MEDFSLHFRRSCIEGGLIKEDAIKWALDHINDDVDQIMAQNEVRKLRKIGRLMHPNELRANGMRANTFMSHEAWNALTAKGRKDPIKAFEKTINHALRTYRAGGRHSLQTDIVYAHSTESSVKHSGFNNFSKSHTESKINASIPKHELWVPWITIGSLIAAFIGNGWFTVIFLIIAITGFIFWFRFGRKYWGKK